MRLTVLFLLAATPLATWPEAATWSTEQKPVFDWASHPENRWVKHSPRPGAPSPGFGWEGSGAYDPHRKQWIHHGGHDGVPQGFLTFTCDLETGLWRQHFPNTSPPGVCCVDGANVYDVANRRFVRFPGASLGHGWQWSRGVKLKRSHVWLYDPESNTWTNMRPPPYREPVRYSRAVLGSLNAGGAYDANHEVALSFGGQGDGGGMNNLFVYDAYANRLERLDAANPPSQRDGMGVAYDTANDCLVMFGSQYASDEKTWIYRYATNRWEALDLDPHPPGKKLGTYSTIPRLAYDSRNRIVLCVAWDTNSNRQETWALDVAKKRWTALKPAVEPTPSMSRSRNLSYSPEHNVFLLELMPRNGPVELWTYRYKQVAAEQRPAPPADLTIFTAPTQARVSWAASPSACVREYHVYRAQEDRPWLARFEKVAAVKSTTFLDGGLKAGKVYFYKVKAVSAAGESAFSGSVRTQPRVLLRPVVSVLAKDRIEVAWKAHPAADVTGYHLYRGVVTAGTVKKGTQKPWSDNDPEYPEPVVVSVKDISDIQKLNDQPLGETSFVDTKVDLTRKSPEAGDYRYAVYAYYVTAVNRLGTESGPSPYALTIPSEPTHVLLREKDGKAEIKWQSGDEKDLTGYRIYKKGKGNFEIVRLTEGLVKTNTFTDPQPGGRTRYWVVAVDALGQEGEPSSPVWYGQSYKGFFEGEWHQ